MYRRFYRTCVKYSTSQVVETLVKVYGSLSDASHAQTSLSSRFVLHIVDNVFSKIALGFTSSTNPLFRI